ncbi:MAG: murein hydrolase activator EnvC family protein [Proteocatella sp.]
MKKSKVLLSLLLIISISSSTVFAASDLGTQKGKLNTVKTEKGKISAEIKEKKQEVKNIKNNIYSLDSKINESQAKLDTMQTQMAGLNVEIKSTKNKITTIEKDLVKNEALLKERLRVMYKTKDVSYLEILLNSENIIDLLSNVNNIQRIVDYDREVLENLEASKKKHEAQKRSLEASKTKMTKIQEQMKAEQAVMEQNMSVQITEKHKIAQDINSLKLQEEELQRESASIEKQIQAILAESARKAAEEAKKNAKPGTKVKTPQAQPNYSGGSMRWPLAVRGTITSGYGSRRDPVNGVSSFHQGLDIAAPKGTAVYAALDGTVIFSGYRNSYGNVVMINHGGGIVTVYAHNSSLVARQGQTVKAGDVISRVGSTGYSTGNHLHFEVRKNGSTVNPRGYI